MSAVPVVMVVAAADNGVIGRDNRLIWRLKTDLRRFRTLTLGRPLIMGRKTFASIGAALPGRHTIVMTRDKALAAAQVAVAHDLEGALAAGQRWAQDHGADSVVVAGGGEIYRQALPFADRLHVTWVHTAPEGDVTWPRPDPARFFEVAREEHPAGPDDEHAFAFAEYHRR